jgi:hypothetical protein
MTTKDYGQVAKDAWEEAICSREDPWTAAAQAAIDAHEAEAPKPAGDDVEGLVELATAEFERLDLGMSSWTDRIRAAVIAVRDAVLAGQKGEPEYMKYLGDVFEVIRRHDDGRCWITNGKWYGTVRVDELKPVRRFRHGQPVDYRGMGYVAWSYLSNGRVHITRPDASFDVDESELTPRMVTDE